MLLLCIQRFAFGIVMIHLASNNVATHLYLSFIQHQHIDTPRTDLCCVYACAFYVCVSGCACACLVPLSACMCGCVCGCVMCVVHVCALQCYQTDVCST